MRPHLIVQIDPAGQPFAEIAPHCIWELVEYFSYSRPHVSYHLDHENFKVTFHHHTREEAQELLDSWTVAEDVIAEHAGV